MMQNNLTRPETIVVVAMSADGKIAEASRNQVLFGSPADKAHLENQMATADGVIFGAGTLRAGGSAMRVTHPELLKQRQEQGKPSQPVQIVCSRSANIDSNLKFFQQPIPRWLLTTAAGESRWREQPGFERILAIETSQQAIDLPAALQHLATLGLKRLAVLGGGELIASLLAVDLIDELWITVCPLILGGSTAPTPVDGNGFLTEQAPRLELLEVKPVGQEVFLHYRRQRDE
ncbi:dihydrofolate reductase family protein [Microcoleus sp. FACHB-68]|uniref:RibD family protein n=1 Tax=Microcoleus sp. FACHB-68 TaxID=2692826 RepID=UPI0016832995|nr:dihydrofolate reductase family protein [Microcoleus sp. FACHB-68]MBD1939808.1 dihydrofolate reductase family protein [Microcoleus sp. FACHB-68]